MKDQSTASMPGFNEAKAAQAAALSRAQLEVTNSPDAQTAAINLKRLEREAQEPFEIKSKLRDVEFPIQFKARTDAANEATVGRNLLQQTDAMMNLMFDEKGNPVVNSGPLGAAINKMAAIAKQAGFSDSFIKDVLATDPSNAQSIEKLRTTLSTEIGRQEMNGAPIRVTEFQRFLETTPGETLLPNSFKWIVENILQPKAKSAVGAYEKVKRMNPAEHNIQAELDDYARDNKWYGVNPGQQTETEPRKAAPAPAPVNAIPPGHDDIVRQELQRRNAAKGAQ
jgi:flagellar motor switch/type III secretory pathway protein FliN